MNMEQIATQFYNVTPIQKSSELVFALSTHCARFTRCSIYLFGHKKTATYVAASFLFGCLTRIRT
jgi:hypothetical protein